MSATDEETRIAAIAALAEGLRSDDAQALRERIVIAIPRYLASNGSRIRFHHWLSGDRAGVGFGLVCEMTADLATGAGQLFAAELFYPGAALVRQLLECGYLLALASERKEEMSTWLDGSAGEIQSMFAPAKMRARSARGFRFEEYQVHCERGGHPRRAGQSFLRGHQDAGGISTRSHWADLSQHLAEIWGFFCTALPLYDPRLNPTSGLYRPADARDDRCQVSALLDAWRRDDPLATYDRFVGTAEPRNKN